MTTLLARVGRRLHPPKPGAPVLVVWESRGATYSGRTTVREDPTLTAAPGELQSGGRPTPAERAFRERWLGSRAGDVAGEDKR